MWEIYAEFLSLASEIRFFFKRRYELVFLMLKQVLPFLSKTKHEAFQLKNLLDLSVIEDRIGRDFEEKPYTVGKSDCNI